MTKKKIDPKDVNRLYTKLIGKSRDDYEKLRNSLIKKYGQSGFRDLQKKSFRKIR